MTINPDNSSSPEALFKSEKDWHNNACLNYGLDDWYIYAEGYKQAADYLVNRVIESGEDQDTLVYPIVFLYRQYGELRLKQLARDACDLLGEPFVLRRTHRLDELWDTAFALIQRVEGGETGPGVLEAGAILKEFSQVDPTAQAFRYPEDRSGRISEIRYINLRRLRDEFAKVTLVLDGVVDAFSYYQDLQNEARSSY